MTNKRIVGFVLYPVDNIFILAGKVWKIVKIQGEKIFVNPIDSNAYLPEFQLKDGIGKYYYYLPKHLRKSRF